MPLGERLGLDRPVQVGRHPVRRGSVVLALAAAAAAMSVCAATAAATVPAHTDVMFVFDTSGSMHTALDEARADITTAESQISTALPDVRFGVAQVKDY